MANDLVIVLIVITCLILIFIRPFNSESYTSANIINSTSANALQSYYAQFSQAGTVNGVVNEGIFTNAEEEAQYKPLGWIR